ncbi:hypothetical protein HETIRDRAFT_430507 [Heterobasidion irregulare TC 32-1]|uniref:Uncharacterized protein n=1 Tax=Heterobasidion irregulare (strain TC 32-1) TaxID=747525 RepID=W4JRG5_HETIT|nr:uncharacterized protein HETIRDRAFT_430507 [Heterobasidion irregulare TC 32-1]ETW76133.1 hypothetical protein HETIRDRAFT_430507 [Heterobasidion irregulare TC 32-1]
MTPPALMGRSAHPSPLPAPCGIVARIERPRITGARDEKARTQRGAALPPACAHARGAAANLSAVVAEGEMDVQTRKWTGGRTHVHGSHGRGVGWARRRRTQSSGDNRALEVPLAGDARPLGLQRVCFESRRSISPIDTPLFVPFLSFRERSIPSLRRVVTAPVRRQSQTLTCSRSQLGA